MGQQTGENDPWRRGESPRQPRGILRSRIHAGAVIAAVDLEPDFERALGRDQGVDRLVRIDQQAQLDPLGQLQRAREPAGDERKGPGQVVEAVLGEHRRLVERRHGHPAGAAALLQPGDLDALVGLDVGPQGDAEAAAALGHRGQVGLELVEVEQEGGRLELQAPPPGPTARTTPGHRNQSSVRGSRASPSALRIARA